MVYYGCVLSRVSGLQPFGSAVLEGDVLQRRGQDQPRLSGDR